jgi:hypothetical protein
MVAVTTILATVLALSSIERTTMRPETRCVVSRAVVETVDPRDGCG